MKIYEARSRKTRIFEPLDITWEELMSKLKSPIYTGETLEDFHNMSKAQQYEIKDVGGFVGGELAEGVRTKSTVLDRCLITLDMDEGPKDAVDRICSAFAPYTFYIYSTHKHTPEKPRLRIVVLLKEPIKPDQYIAASRKLAEKVGLDYFDDTTYEPHRMMFYPSVAKDGEWVSIENKGEPFDALSFIENEYQDWTDPTSWPLSSREQDRGILPYSNANNKLSDPREKKGVVGAFCKAYTIEEAISLFLPDVYTPAETENRYTYSNAVSYGGLCVYDHLYAYSFHATDPVSGRSVNAFDLVRIHKFGDLDKGVVPGTKPQDMPSFIAMKAWVKEDALCVQYLAEEAKANFEEDLSWKDSVSFSDGEVDDSVTNISYIVLNDPKLDAIKYNQFTEQICVTGQVPWDRDNASVNWTDSDFAGLSLYMDAEYGIYSTGKLQLALDNLPNVKRYHPVKEYLESLQWDGVHRLNSLLIDYLGADDDAYTRSVTEKTFVAAVARIYEPGKKFDYMLVLQGDQGLGKSTLFAKLGGRWFSDALTMSDMQDKSAAEKLRGYWILEISELNGMRKAEVETIKAFISRQDDIYRVAYGRNVESHPRQCIVVGTTNQMDGYLRDTTGNRRFWPVAVHSVEDSEHKVWKMSKETVDQVWAEAKHLYDCGGGKQLILPAELEDAARARQRAALETDPREGYIVKYLDTKLPPTNVWKRMDIGQRRDYLCSDGAQAEKGVAARDYISIIEIWTECFRNLAANIERKDIYDIQNVLAKLGWKRIPRKVDCDFHGWQTVFVRPDSALFLEDSGKLKSEKSSIAEVMNPSAKSSGRKKDASDDDTMLGELDSDWDPGDKKGSGNRWLDDL